MPNVIKDRIEKTRNTLRSWGKDRVHDFEVTTEPLKERAEELKQAVDAGRGRLRDAEVQVLETAADTLARARKRLGETAPLLSRGEKALREVMAELGAVPTGDSPIPHYDAKNARQAIRAVEKLDLDALRVIRAHEVLTKNRVTVLRAIDTRIADLLTH